MGIGRFVVMRRRLVIIRLLMGGWGGEGKERDGRLHRNMGVFGRIGGREFQG